MAAPLSSLRFRLMLLVGLALLPVMALALYTAAEQRRNATRATHAETLRMARLCAGNQERLIEGSRQLLVTLIQVPDVWEMDGDTCSALFAKVREQYPLYANIGLLNRGGDLIASALPAGPANFSSRTYFQRAMDSRSFAVGDFQIGQITHKPTINVALPILDKNQEPFAVIYAALELTWLNQMAQLANLPADSTVAVVDRSGTIIASVPEAEQWIGRRSDESPIPRAVFAMRGSEGTTAGWGRDGVDRIYAFKRINSSLNGGGGEVIVGVSKREAFHAAWQTLERQLLILGCIAVAALGGAWIAADALVLRRVKGLLATTRRLASGDLAARTESKSGARELNELATAFDEMAVALESRTMEQQRAEEALRKGEAMFRNLFEASPDAVFVEDFEGQVLDVNPAACRLHGLKREELVGKCVFDLVPESCRAEVKAMFARWTTGELVSLVSESLTVDGRRVPVGIRASRIDFNGTPALLFHVRDITERKRIENDLRRAYDEMEQRVVERTEQLATANAALRETTERFELVLMGTNDGIWDWDLRTNKVYFSRRWKAMLGYEYDEIENDFSEWKARLHPDDETRAFKIIDDYLTGKIPVYELEHRLRAKDGTWRWILARGFALRDENGKAYRMAGSHVDLTERIKAQNELKQLAEDLRRSNEDLEQFAYVASHDLQEPLRMVASYTQLLERRYKDQLDATANEFIHFAVDGAQRMQQFIHDLLEYSRVGTREILVEEIDLDAVLEQALGVLRLAVEEKHATITRDPLPKVRGDAGQLARLFQNLLSNALKFSGPEPLQIHVGAQRVGGEWEISVRDNGIGIDPKHFERVFVIFQRLHTREEYSGTGLGLAICKKIVERHGGRMRVESAPGKGATFSFTFPVRPGTVAADGGRAEL